MSIRTKSFLSFGVLLLLFLAASFYQIVKTNVQNAEIREVNEKTLKSSLLAQELQQTLYSYQIQSMLPATGYATFEEVKPTIDGLVKSFISVLDQYQTLNPESKGNIQTLKQDFSEYVGGDAGKATVLYEAVGEFNNSNIENITKSLKNVVSSNDELRKNSVILQVFIFLIAICVSFFFARSLINPIKRLINASSIISAGDLSRPLDLKSRDEIDQLAGIFEKMRLNLSTFIKSSQDTANQVTTSSEKLSESAQNTAHSVMQMTESIKKISSGSHTQMRSTEETAFAIEEMTRGVLQITDSTSKVAELSISTEQRAKEGNELLDVVDHQMNTLGQTVSKFADSVNKLEDHSKSINHIIDVIKSISSQTNLLSLNAGIEAARAGEHGKGFAVVANEIRKLAEQTNVSSDRIYEVIQNIKADTRATVIAMENGQAEVKHTGQSVRLAKEAFENIMRATIDISEQMQEVSSAAEEMSVGSEQVSAAVSELADIAKNAYVESQTVVKATEEQMTLLKETASSVDILSKSSKDLKATISTYKV
ncbi:MAG: HAMP domain-containing methyl-accepting chemotaxis protein [Paenibacillus sp.]|nr:HAMP domain-containing methyl-accepting chemotaxis protein [Paenibacillus sp.]